MHNDLNLGTNTTCTHDRFLVFVFVFILVLVIDFLELIVTSIKFSIMTLRSFEIQRNVFENSH